MQKIFSATVGRHFRQIAWPVFFLLCGATAFGQQTDYDTSGYLPNFTIEEVIVTNESFKPEDFIRRVKNDTTFYKAFKSLRIVTYNAENNIRIFDKKGKIKAALESETKQIYRNGCRSMQVLDETVKGDFYKKNGEYRYYTAELFASLFFTKGKICGENNIVKGSLDAGGNGIEKRKAQLKQLMFNPGARIGGIPGMGQKAAIFSPEVAKMYDFSVTKEEKNGFTCYKFSAKARPEYAKEVVINSFVTWFRNSDYAIVARDYSLSYNTIAYDFDVVMHVDLIQRGAMLLPTYISYRGNWKVAFQDRERVDFTVKFYY